MCPALAHLDLNENQIGPDGAENLSWVLALCPPLAHRDEIEAVGEVRLRALWRGQDSSLLL